jgi:single-strand DNA-binding protein
MNHVSIIGRLTRDADCRYTQEGTCVLNFNLAVNKFVKGEKKADFIPCVAFGKTAEAMGNYASLKGSHVAVDGRINTRTYEDKDGKKVYVVEVMVNNVEFLGTKAPAGNDAGATSGADSFGSQVFPDDEIPF